MRFFIAQRLSPSEPAMAGAIRIATLPGRRRGQRRRRRNGRGHRHIARIWHWCRHISRQRVHSNIIVVQIRWRRLAATRLRAWRFFRRLFRLPLCNGAIISAARRDDRGRTRIEPLNRRWRKSLRGGVPDEGAHHRCREKGHAHHDHPRVNAGVAALVQCSVGESFGPYNGLPVA